jgi:hypothetical protein
MRLGQHPATVMPLSASVLTFAVLLLAVFGDQGVELVRKDDAATACH